jgi:PAS domain S-box-containing protein
MTAAPVHPVILIIDDMPSNLGLVVSLLENQGCRVSIAQDGDEGLQRAGLLQPDLILLDAMMPGIDGFETCRRLKRQVATCDIPVIFMTALTTPEHKVSGFQAGAVDYVTKPLQMEEVLARIETHLKLRAAQRALEAQNAELEKRVAERTAELAAREREFRSLAENHPDGIVRLDLDGRHLYVNDAALRSTGLTERELIGKTLCELPLPGNPEAMRPLLDDLRQVVASGNSSIVEFVWPNGRVSEVRHILEYDGKGRVVSVLAIARDITERKQIEKERYLLNQALDNAFDAVYLLDRELQIRYVNQAAVEELGYGREALLSMTLLDIDPGVTREAMSGLMVQTQAKGRFPGTVESSHRRKDGTVFPIEVGATTFSYEGETLFLTTVRNITERKRVEVALAAREREFRTLAENLPDNLARYDRQGRQLYMNVSLRALLAKVGERLRGVPPPEASTPGMTYADYLAHIKDTIETGRSREMELLIPDSGDGTRIHQIRFVAEHDAQGEIVGALAIGLDITEHKQHDALLAQRAELEQRLSSYVNNAPGFFYTSRMRPDGSSAMTFASPRIQEMFGISPMAVSEDLAPLFASAYPEDLAALLKARDASAQALRPFHHEFRITHPEKGERWMELNSLPHREEDGSTVWHGFMLDISERKQMEALLQKRELEFRTLADNIPDNIIRYDKEGRKIYLNSAAARVMGVNTTELLNQTPEETPEHMRAMRIDDYSQRLRQVLETGEPQELRVELMHVEQGEQIHDLRIVAERDEQGDVIGALMVGRDITDLKRYERELESSRQQIRELAARRERAREDERKRIARELHDELGQMLTALRMEVMMLPTHFGEKLEAKSGKLTRRIDQTIQMVRDVVSMVRPSALDMGLGSALEWLGQEFSRFTGVECRVIVPEEPIALDEEHSLALFRIVQESLTNVARHAHASRVDILLEMQAGAGVLEVRDNGAGFNHIQVSDKKTFGLLGMRERVLVLGGKVSVTSSEGKGTALRVEFPITQRRGEK